MSRRFHCLHGHSLEIGAARGGQQSHICPFCGSLVQISRDGSAMTLGTLGITLVPASMRDPSFLETDLSAHGPEDTASEPTLLSTSSYDYDNELPAATPTTSYDYQRPPNPPIGLDMSTEASTSKLPSPDQPASSPPTPQKELRPPTLDGYEILEELGRGGMGIVYLAFDEKHGREVALKTLQRMGLDDLVRFKQEFRALADIAHPNLAPPFELVSDGHTWCFTMEVLKGVEFLDYVWSEFEALQVDSDRVVVSESHEALAGTSRMTRRRVNRLYDAIKQLTQGLDVLHRAGKLHSDIKPSNVMVTRNGRLVLLDFGLVAEISKGADGRVRQVIQGTPHYMSPEQAACKPLTTASDWYAVGVMLYEVLTGRLPFVDQPSRIMLRKQFERPIEPRVRQPDIPVELSDLCMALLEIEPEKRPTAIDVLRAVDADDTIELIESQSHSVQSVELVGRAAHLELLRQAVTEVREGEARSVFIHGLSGMGKSVLSRAFLDTLAHDENVIILEGRCYEQESVPFKALDSLIDSLVSHLLKLGPEQLSLLLPEDSLPLMRLFPVLGQLPLSGEKPAIDNADQQELRQRALAGLRALLAGLAESATLVLSIDDLQWGDVDSAHLLADLVRPPDSPHLLLLGSYRREDATTSTSLVALSEAYEKGHDQPHRGELAVDALAPEDAEQLALKLLGASDADAREAARRIGRESGGSPFFVWELAQNYQDDTGTDQGSLELDEVIWSRVRRLPDDARRLLEVFAVAGRPMRAGEAYSAIDEVKHGPALLAQLRAGNFIRTTDRLEDTVVEPYHDRIRESVVNHLATAKVKGHYLKLALSMEHSGSISPADIERQRARTADYQEPVEPFQLDGDQWQRIFDLACFFDAAGKSERALPYALAAAEQALSQNALEASQQQFGIARRGSDDSSDPIRFRISEGLGDVLMMRGRYDQADKQFQTARALAKDDLTLARIAEKRGYLYFKKGEMQNAADHFERALRELGNPPPTNAVTQMAAMIREVGVQLLHTCLPNLFTARRRAGTSRCQRDLLRARLYDGLGYPYWFTRGPIPTLWTHLRHMNLTERYPHSIELGRSYAMHAVMITAIPLARRGADYAERAYQIHGDLGDRLGQGKARSFQTFSLLALGRFREGVQSGREAVRLLEQAGDVWEANMARIILSQPLYFLGDLRGSHLEAGQAYRIGKETGDSAAMAIALYFWVTSAASQIPPGALQAERERNREDPLSTAAAIQGRGLELLLREDNPAEAAEVIQESLEVARRRGIRNPCLFCGVTWKATALRILAQRDGSDTAWRRAHKAIRDAMKVTRQYRSCRAQALRERAYLAIQHGRQGQATRFLEESMAVATQQEARYEYAKSLLARGEAGLKFGWASAGQQLEQAQAKIDELEDLSSG